MNIEYKVKSVAKVEGLNGDLFFVHKRDDNHILVVGIDILGHGENAHVVYDFIYEKIMQNRDLSPDEILESLDMALVDKRKAVGSVILINPDGLMECSLIGNVVVRVLGENAHRFIGQDGTIGEFSPIKIKTESHILKDGDVVLMHSDGISGHFESGDFDNLSRIRPAEITSYVMGKYQRPSDDASVIALKVSS